jgi:hypothetical protein
MSALGRRLAAGLAAALAGGGLALAQQPAATAPRTTPERTEHRETSRAAEVDAFAAACATLPRGDRLTITSLGRSHQARELRLWHVREVAAAPTPRLRVVVIGNIHAGEVEGKEALQLLLREFTLGQHDELLAQLELWLVPIYNVDGNEAVGTQHRAGQNGPDVAGQRANGIGLDLNRDFVKAEALETRALLQLFLRVDPHLFVDLHTTNGSYHGYHLTYAPSLCPGQDPGLSRLQRALLDDATAGLRREGYASFDYGNFETRDWDGGGAPSSTPGVRGWYSYDHRPRYGVNYYGLRNRLAVLSEAYSYADFATRIAATRAFVLELLRSLVARGDAVRRATAAADAAAVAGAPLWLPFDTTFGLAETLPVLVGEVQQVAAQGDLPVRFVRQGEGRPESMPVFRSFVARSHRRLPAAWAVLTPSDALRDRLELHGIASEVLAAPRQVSAQRFVVTQKKKPKRPFQGHQELVLAGHWQPAADHELPAGTLLVTARQPRARLAAQLLEAESDDSLSSWNFLEATTTTHYPVLRLPDGP